MLIVSEFVRLVHGRKVENLGPRRSDNIDDTNDSQLI